MGHLALKSRHQNSWNGPHAGSKITLKFKRSSVKQKDKVIHRNGKIIILETNWSKEDVSILKKQKCKFIFIKLYKFECALKISWGKWQWKIQPHKIYGMQRKQFLQRSLYQYGPSLRNKQTISNKQPNPPPKRIRKRANKTSSH